jgi:hypothetical protein
MDIRLHVDRDGNWQAAVERLSAGVAVEVVKEGMDAFSAHALPGRMAEINADPRVRGAR